MERDLTYGPSDDRRGATTPFWERPETVAWFAARPPDERVLEAFPGGAPGARVLDLGCAAGRHVHWLLERGYDAYGLDASHAMVAHTRSRIAPIVGADEAERRIVLGDMDDLGRFDDGTVDAVIAIGILPGADSDARWHATVGEIARVLRPGGTLLLTHFMPPDGADGTPATPLPDEPHRYADPETGRAMLLLRRDELDAALARHLLEPLHPTHVARATTMRGHRPVLNGHVRRAHAALAAPTIEEAP